ncbi:MAG TPA: c-type cytochrome, partial [Terriglobia bacterium]|nr:c-type cytochrome [Terriglobia bacterium]
MKLSGIIACLLLVGMAFAGAGDGSWLRKVSEKDRARLNPLANDPDAAAAGAKIYAEHCASCHGDNGEGKMQG